MSGTSYMRFSRPQHIRRLFTSFLVKYSSSKNNVDPETAPPAGPRTRDFLWFIQMAMHCHRPVSERQDTASGTGVESAAWSLGIFEDGYSKHTANLITAAFGATWNKSLLTNFLDRHRRGRRLAAKVGNCRQRTCEWRKKWIVDCDWPRWNYQNPGVHDRLFTPQEEAAIKEFTVTNYFIPKVLFTNEDFRDVAISAFLEKHPDIDTAVPSFNVPAGFIAGFKLRNGFSSRSCHLNRRRLPVSVEIKSA
jgi:hypothetical protein